MGKIDQIKKLMTFLRMNTFTTTEQTIPTSLYEALCEYLEEPQALHERDHVCLRFSLDTPRTLHVIAYDESHHNGSFGNYYKQNMSMFSEFSDHVLEVLTEKAHAVIANQLRKDEQRRFDERVRARFCELLGSEMTS